MDAATLVKEVRRVAVGDDNTKELCVDDFFKVLDRPSNVDCFVEDTCKVVLVSIIEPMLKDKTKLLLPETRSPFGLNAM